MRRNIKIEIAAALTALAIQVVVVVALLGWLQEALADELRYQWDPVDGGTQYTLLYELQTDEGGGWVSAGPVGSTQKTVMTQPLEPGDQVQARVRAYLDDGGTERVTSDWSTTHVYYKAPSAPTGVIVIAISVQVQ